MLPKGDMEGHDKEHTQPVSVTHTIEDRRVWYSWRDLENMHWLNDGGMQEPVVEKPRGGTRFDRSRTTAVAWPMKQKCYRW